MIDHEVEPPESCGQCGTPLACCGGECLDAHDFARQMDLIRHMITSYEAQQIASCNARKNV